MNPFDVTGFLGTAGVLGLMTLLFTETGLLFGVIFPGDSLLFTAGILAAQPEPFASIWTLVFALPFAAALGDQCGYLIGRFAGPRVLRSRMLRWIGPEPVARTSSFFERYGALTVLFARFIAVVRTLTPVMAGLARMNWAAFTIFSILGSLLWAGGVTTLGYLLGGIPFFRDNFEIIILVCVGVVVVPMVVTIFLRARQLTKPRGESNEAAGPETLGR